MSPTPSSPDSLPIFPPALLSNFPTPIPQDYNLRPLQRNDWSNGFFECLAGLTWVGDGDGTSGGEQGKGEGEEAAAKEVAKDGARFREKFEKQFDWMRTKGDGWFYNVVIECEGRVAGTGVLIVERKFIHDFGTAGHIEDISISEQHQGKGLGKLLIAALDHVAREVGCYKCILDCSPKNTGFYEKCGYEKSGQEMSHYFETKRSDYSHG